MCDSKLNILFGELSSTNDKIRVESVHQLFDLFQKNEDSQESIINKIVKGLVSHNVASKNGLANAFQKILQNLDKKSFDTTLEKIKENLFINNVTNLTKSDETSMQLGSILTFDALVTSTTIKNISKETISEFLKFILDLVNVKYFGYIVVNILSNYFKTISKKDFEKVKTFIKKDLLNIDMFEKCPHIIILWLSFNTEQKKILNSVNKSIPSLHSSGIISKLPSLMKTTKSEHMLFLLGEIVSTQFFSTVMKSIFDICSKPDSDLKDKQLILLVGFEILKPKKESHINKLASEKRKSLIDLVWGNLIFTDLLFKQLSTPELELHETSINFIINLKDSEELKQIMEYTFKVLIANKSFINWEFKISQTKRISHYMIQSIDDSDLLNTYLSSLKEFFLASEKNDQKIYFFEQLTSLFNKLPDIILELLLTINMEYNHSNVEHDIIIVESAKAAFLRCLETVQLIDIEKLKSLLIKSVGACKDDTLILPAIKSVLKYWECTPAKSKKRQALAMEKVTVNFKDSFESMFVALQSHICLYMLSQSYDIETVDIVEDVQSCLNEFKNITSETEICKKKAKCIENSEPTEKTWKLVLTDILTLFMEQNCHYLRNLSAKVFKAFVIEGHCDDSVIKLIKSTILDIDVEINGVDKKKKVKEVEETVSNNEESGDESEESCDDSVVSCDDSEDSAGTEENQNEIKSRIFAALGAMSVDVDSDADDNCPDDDGTNLSEDINDVEKKSNLKDKRFTVLQLRQFRNRCIDLLDIIILHSSKLAVKMNAFLAFLDLLKKTDVEIETHLMKTILSLKTKFVSKETFSSQEITSFINDLIQVVEKCHQSKNLVRIFSDMMVILLKINKNVIADIVIEFKLIIENCIIDKKNHPMKAVFLTMFETFPEIGWAFHSQVLSYIDEKQTHLVQYRAFEILRRILQNKSIRTRFLQKDDEMEGSMLFSKHDIRHFVTNLSSVLTSIIINLDVTKNSKHSSIVLGAFIDCIKLCPDINVSKDLVEKVKSVSIKSLPKDLKKTLNQFVSAIDLAKSSLKL